MNQPILVIDCHYMCHRAFHSMGELSFKSKATGVIFGFLKSITALKDQFSTDRVAFCFEHPVLFRRDLYPDYKRRRRSKQRTGAEARDFEGLQLQISELQKRYLPKIGFRNVFSFRGMESDDIMAALALQATEDDPVVLVTADSDLYQCLRRDKVTIYSPQKRKLLTAEWFFSAHQIYSSWWYLVKALSGCKGDEVPGVRGVGEQTALRFLRSELNANSKVFRRIGSSEGLAIRKRNERLVKLPFEGCPVPKIVPDEVTKEKWLEVCGMLGMRSLAQHPPIATRKTGRLL